MPERPRIPIPFGKGLDRDTGLMAVEATSFADLRNFHIIGGKFVLRDGASRFFADPFAGSAVVAVHPIRSRSVVAVITYTESTGVLVLHLLNQNGTLVDDFEFPVSLAAATPRPTLSTTDVYRYLVIAHDEADFGFRLPTVVFDTVDQQFLTTLGGVSYGFEGLDGVPAFRGVKRHLNYLVGWGWGTSDDPDRPEYLRISLPSEPLSFDKQHFFLVGQQGEPIVQCDPAGQILAIKKRTDIYALTGYSRATFGVQQPLDTTAGQVASRLSTSVNGINYFWSDTGPRRTGGGPSEDLAIPLDLGGPTPSDLAPETFEGGFCVYDNDHREVLWIFGSAVGSWAYVFSLDNPPESSWSYREWPGLALTAGGILYRSTVGTPGAGQSDMIATLGAPVDQTETSITWPITLAGTPDAADRVEVWVREPVARISSGGAADVWRIAHSELVSGRTAFAVEVGAQSLGVCMAVGEQSDAAVRVVRGGTAGSNYPTLDPANWPAASRQIANVSAFTLNADPVPISTSLRGGTPDKLKIVLSTDPTTAIGLGQHTQVRHDVQVSDGMAGWTDVVVSKDFDTSYVLGAENANVEAEVEAFAGLTRDVRIRAYTVESDADGFTPKSAWVTIAGVVFEDPLGDLITAIGSDCKIYLATPDTATVEGSPGSGLHFEWTGVTNVGTVSSVVLRSPNGGHFPVFTDTPPRVEFTGNANDKLNDINQPVNLIALTPGFTWLAVIRFRELGGTRQEIFSRAGAEPKLVVDVDGTLEWDGQVNGGVDRRGDWVVVGYTMAAGAGVGNGIDGDTFEATTPTPFAPITNPFTLSQFKGSAFSEGTPFKGDVFCLCLVNATIDGTQATAIYNALVALALANGITVTN